MSVAGGDKKRPGKVSDGTWVVVGMEQNGMKLHADDLEKLSMKLTIKGNDYIVAMADKIIDKGTSAVDTTKRPNALDIKSEFGPNKGKTILGIVEINGDSMKACYDLKDNKRPTTFATKEGTGLVLILYKREANKDGK
jgi:uncharacterized protein (TIGR03067 family)